VPAKDLYRRVVGKEVRRRVLEAEVEAKKKGGGSWITCADVSQERESGG
jgi:hypothetical protein